MEGMNGELIEAEVQHLEHVLGKGKRAAFWTAFARCGDETVSVSARTQQAACAGALRAAIRSCK